MLRQKVKSSNIATVGYDSMKQELEIEFVTGGIYKYLKVPEDVYINLMTAPSIGSAVHKLIKGKFEFKQEGK